MGGERKIDEVGWKEEEIVGVEEAVDSETKEDNSIMHSTSVPRYNQRSRLL